MYMCIPNFMVYLKIEFWAIDNSKNKWKVSFSLVTKFHGLPNPWKPRKLALHEQWYFFSKSNYVSVPLAHIAMTSILCMLTTIDLYIIEELFQIRSEYDAHLYSGSHHAQTIKIQNKNRTSSLCHFPMLKVFERLA